MDKRRRRPNTSSGSGLVAGTPVIGITSSSFLLGNGRTLDITEAAV
jgi:hypothetical protein